MLLSSDDPGLLRSADSHLPPVQPPHRKHPSKKVRTATTVKQPASHRSSSVLPCCLRWLSSSTGGEVDKAPAAADAVVTETKKEEGDGQTAPQADVVFECRHSVSEPGGGQESSAWSMTA